MRHIHHSNHVAGLVGVDHFLHAAGPEDQVVGKENGNRLGTDKMARAPDRMAEPCRLLLADIEDRSGVVQHVLDQVQRLVLALCGKGLLQLEGMVEMVLDGCLVAAGNEDEFLDARFRSLLDRILDQGLVDDRQHFLGHRLCRGEKPRAKTAHRKNGLLDHGSILAITRGGWYPWIAFRESRVKPAACFHNWYARSCQASVLPMSTPFLRPLPR